MGTGINNIYPELKITGLPLSLWEKGKPPKAGGGEAITKKPQARAWDLEINLLAPPLPLGEGAGG